jgi:hypothetical protein
MILLHMYLGILDRIVNDGRSLQLTERTAILDIVPDERCFGFA